MASSPLPTQSVPNNNDNDGNNEDGCSSYFLKTDWWLIKADKDFEGKRLAVAGLTSRRQQQVRVFYSAPITRRFDVFTLETADGICVVIQGLMNKVRTVENGFSSEAFNHFLFGFPTYWEEYVKTYFREEPSEGIGFRNISTAEKATTKPARFSRSVEEVRVSIDSKFSDGNPEGTEQLTGLENRSKHKEKEDDGNATELKRRRKNSPLPKDSDGVIRCIDDNLCGFNDSNISSVCLGVIHESRSRSPAVDDFTIAEFSENLIDRTMSVPMMQCKIVKNSDTPNAVEMDAVNVTPSNYGVKRSSIRLKYSGKKQKENTASTCSVNDKDNNFCGVERSNSAGICLGVTCGSMSRFPAVKDLNIPEFSGNQINIAMADSMVRSTINLNSNSSSAVEMDAENAIPVSNSGGRSSSIRLKHIRRKQKENPASRPSSNYKDNDLRGFNSSSDAGVCHGSVSIFAAVGDFNIPELSGNQTGVTATMAVPMVQSRIDATPNPVSRCSMKDKDEMCIRKVVELPDGKRPKGNSSQSAVRSGVKIGASAATPSQSVRKRSRNLLGTPKSKGKKQHSSANKSKRKIVFDSHVSPLTPEREVCIVSPESLSSKRSRSGRLVVPPLQFWRNQIPIYDVDRNMIGIREDMHVLKPSRVLATVHGPGFIHFINREMIGDFSHGFCFMVESIQAFQKWIRFSRVIEIEPAIKQLATEKVEISKIPTH